jgi:1-deoxy-D-xylulose-5-phosphate reductoisomerase
MNKGFEILEAHWLFGIPVDRIQVLVHPQSIVHALVELKDGSVLAQMASPDMTLPVQYALSWPERWEAPRPILDLSRVSALQFEPPDPARFPCLSLAYRAAQQGGVVPAAMNAADEIAVSAFLNHEIRFSEIAAVIEEVMDQAPRWPADSIERVLEADRLAREQALSALRVV